MDREKVKEEVTELTDAYIKGFEAAIDCLNQALVGMKIDIPRTIELAIADQMNKPNN